MSGNALGHIQQKNLSEIAAERIGEAIVEGRFAPGIRVNEVDLAKQLGISRSPVREALFLLESKGLVVKSNKGTSVWDPTEADVDEIFSLRVSVECLAAEWAMPRLTDEALAELEAMIDRQRKLEAGEHYCFSVTRENRLFHERIVLLSGHTRLIRLWGQIADQYEVLAHRRMTYDRHEVQTKMVPAHEDIVEALRKRDLARVEYLHSQINEQVCRQIKEAMRATSIRHGHD